MSSPPHRSPASASPLFVYLALALTIGAASAAYIRRSQQELRAQVERELLSIADAKVAELLSWRAESLRSWTGMVENTLVAGPLRATISRATRTDDLAHRIAAALESKRQREGASAAILLDARGDVVLSAAGLLPLGERDVALARSAVRSRRTLVDDGEHTGDPLTIAVLIDGGPDERGVLLVRYDLSRSLTPLVRVWPHATRTAEPVLVRRDGEFVGAVTAPLHTRASLLPLTTDMPTARAIKGASGIVECDDYRGVPVIAAVRPVPGTPWFLSAKMDRAEVFAPGREHAFAFGAATLLALAVAGAAAWFWWRAQVSHFREREQALEQRALRDRFDALWSSANDVVAVLDAEGKLLDANDRAVALYGYRRDEFTRLHVSDIRSPEAASDLARHDEELQRRGSVRFETVHRRKDGSTFPAEVSWSLVRTGGAPLTLVVVRDLTEREAAAAAARYQQTLLANLNDAVIGTDPSTRITAWAGAAERVYGWTAREAIGHPIAKLLGGERPDEVNERILAEVAGKDRTSLEVRHARKDGQLIDVEVTVVALRDAAGETTGFVAVHRDVTERRRAEQRQQRLQTELGFADRLASIGTLAAGVAHEINNPLAWVVANLDYVQRTLAAPQPGDAGVDVEAQASAVADAADGARRIGEIVRGLQAFSRTDRSERCGPVDVGAAVGAAVRMARGQARPRARLITELAECPRVHGREHEVAQVALNLILNAIHAIPEGRPDAHEVRVSTRLDPTGAVELEVRDTGSGIAPEHLSRIFDPFFTTKKASEGSGLGLSICRGLVERMGGEIRVQSAVGRGTTFTVSLPAGAPEAAPASPAPLAAPAGRGRVLVIDDEPLVCSSIRRALGDAHEVVAVHDARAALELIGAGERFDVVLCDIVMPGLSGADCWEHVSRLSPETARRMLFLTGGAFTPRAREFLATQGGRVIEKPFEPTALRARVADAIARAA